MMCHLLKKMQATEASFISPWADYLRDEMGRLGMLDIWIGHGLGFNCEYIKNSIKLKIR